MYRHALPLLAFTLLLPAFASPLLAKEESKLQILLLPPGTGGGNGNGIAQGQGPIGALRSFLQDPGALRQLQLRMRGLAPSLEHTLLALLDASDPAPVELCRFTTDANGGFTGDCEIGKGDDVAAPVDPRGRLLVVNDGTDDVLAGWLYGAPADDGPMTKVKELTRLAPDETTAPSGSVDARYDMRPNGHGSFGIQMRGVPAGDYDLWVDGVLVETVTPNPGGSAKATFRTKPSQGKGKAHNKRGPLNFDPRRKQIELKQEDVLYFSGPMLAQIEGLNVCSATPTPLVNVSPAGVTAALEVESDCETALQVNATGLAAGTYDVLVDGTDRGDLAVADDGMGGTAGALRFDPTPDDVDEQPLAFPVSEASSVELVAQP
jgi:hypothetical protein